MRNQIKCVHLTIQKQIIMKKEIIYKGKTIIESTNGYFTAYPSKYSAHTAKDFKSLNGAKKYLDRIL